MKNSFAAVERAIAELRLGRMIILLDDENRENEGDLVVAAEHASAEIITFMSRHACGLICLPMSGELIDKLGLSMMTTLNRSPFSTAFTVSIEAAIGVSTGISAADRARTIQVAIAEDSGPQDIISPGHIFPLRALNRGVLERKGQTEGSVDLVRLAGMKPAAVICEIMNEDGSMSRRDELIKFAQKHTLEILTVQDIIEYRIYHENLLEVIAEAQLPLERHGEFTMTLFNNKIDHNEHFALVKPVKNPQQPPLVRIHSECITGDVFGSCTCDCGAQLEESLSKISNEGGVLIYLRQEGRGIGLGNKLKAYALQEQGYDTVEANIKLGLPVDNREYGVAFQILKYLKINSLRLITNNPRKVNGLKQYGIDVFERIPLVLHTEKNRTYLKTKQDKLGHFLGLE